MGIASACGHRKLITKLINARANLHQYSPDGYLPFHYACAFGNPDFVKYMLDAKCSVTQRNKRNQRTPLMISALHGRTGIAELLVSKNADIRCKNLVGQTALDFAN